MPLSFYRRFQLQDLQPTSLTILLTDCSIKQPIGILENVPAHVDKFIVSCDFIILDMDENFQVPIILGRPFLPTTGAVIDVQTNTISFQMREERLDFCLPPPITSSCLSTPHPLRSLSMLTLMQLFLRLKCLMERGFPYAARNFCLYCGGSGSYSTISHLY